MLTQMLEILLTGLASAICRVSTGQTTKTVIARPIPTLSLTREVEVAVSIGMSQMISELTTSVSTLRTK